MGSSSSSSRAPDPDVVQAVVLSRTLSKESSRRQVRDVEEAYPSLVSLSDELYLIYLSGLNSKAMNNVCAYAKEEQLASTCSHPSFLHTRKVIRLIRYIVSKHNRIEVVDASRKKTFDSLGREYEELDYENKVAYPITDVNVMASLVQSYLRDGEHVYRISPITGRNTTHYSKIPRGAITDESRVTWGGDSFGPFLVDLDVAAQQLSDADVDKL